MAFLRQPCALTAAPLVSAAAVLSIALGLWTTTTVFAVVNALILAPLPAAAPDRLVNIGASRHHDGFGAVSYPDYVSLRDGTDVFEGVAAHQPIEVGWRRAGQSEPAWAEIVSGNYFEVLGTRMAMGRGFITGEDAVPATRAAVVVSDDTWRSALGGDPLTVVASVGLVCLVGAVAGYLPARRALGVDPASTLRAE